MPVATLTKDAFFQGATTHIQSRVVFMRGNGHRVMTQVEFGRLYACLTGVQL